MRSDRKKYILICEFYLRNLPFINRQLEYKLRLGDTSLPVTVKKLYKPIPFAEILSVSTVINRTLEGFDAEKRNYIFLRYRKNTTYEVIGGLMNKRRSTVFQLGTSILDDIVFAVLLDAKAGAYLRNADMKCYFLSEK